MMKRSFLLLSLTLFAVGCASNSDYGVEQPPSLKTIEGRESVDQAEREIERENQRSLGEGEESMFQTNQDDL